MRRVGHLQAQPRKKRYVTGPASANMTEEEAFANNAAARASVSTTAKKGGANYAAAQASTSTIGI